MQCHWTEKAMTPTPVLLPGESQGRRRLVGCSPWGHWGSDTTERLHFHFSLSCIGEGNGNPLQCSCLENPRDGASWWAAVYGVAESRTWLKWLSSNATGILIQIALNLYIASGSIDILMILSLSIHERGISFRLFVSSSVSFINVLELTV